METAPSGEASAPPAALLFTLWIPVVAVVAWTLTRVMSGRWPDEPGPGPGPLPPEDGPVAGA